MNCYEFQGNISSYIDKELSLSRVKDFDRHLETCLSCKDSYEGVLSVLNSFKDSRRVSVSSAFDARLRSRIKSSETGTEKRYRRLLQGPGILGFEPKYAVASAAALTLIVVLSIGLLPDKETVTSGNRATVTTRGGDTPSPDYREPNPVMSQQEFADDSKDDSTNAPENSPRQKGEFDQKIKLVRDQK